MFDMTKCKIGDKLISREGEVYTLLRKVADRDYPYVLTRTGAKETSRTVEGYFWTNTEGGDWDIVGFATDKVAKPKPKRVCKVKPVNKLLGLIEWIATQSHSKIFTEHDYIRGSFCIRDAQFEFEYQPETTKALITGAGEVRWTKVHTLNNFKGAVTKLLKG
jgi:hypothetical protein